MRNASSWAHALGPVLIVMIGCALSHHEQSPSSVTTARLRYTHGVLLSFHAEQGGLPDSLAVVCATDTELCRLKLDGWGRPVVYSRMNGDFLLRSSGADGVLNTTDDIVLSSANERSKVHALAGCYSVSMPWWESFNSNMIVLDTTPFIEGYDARPSDVEPFLGAEWIPHRADSLTLYWIGVDEGVSLRLTLRNDSLLGLARDVDGHMHRVTAIATTCP